MLCVCNKANHSYRVLGEIKTEIQRMQRFTYFAGILASLFRCIYAWFALKLELHVSFKRRCACFTRQQRILIPRFFYHDRKKIVAMKTPHAMFVRFFLRIIWNSYRNSNSSPWSDSGAKIFPSLNILILSCCISVQVFLLSMRITDRTDSLVLLFALSCFLYRRKRSIFFVLLHNNAWMEVSFVSIVHSILLKPFGFFALHLQHEFHFALLLSVSLFQRQWEIPFLCNLFRFMHHILQKKSM